LQRRDTPGRRAQALAQIAGALAFINRYSKANSEVAGGRPGIGIH
jgi:hypothetical protein